MLEKFLVASETSTVAIKYSWNKGVAVIGGPRRYSEFVQEVGKVLGGIGEVTSTKHGNILVYVALDVSKWWTKLDELRIYYTVTKLDRLGRMLN